MRLAVVTQARCSLPGSGSPPLGVWLFWQRLIDATSNFWAEVEAVCALRSNSATEERQPITLMFSSYQHVANALVEEQ